MANTIPASIDTVKRLMNLHLKSQEDYEEGMEIEDIKIINNGLVAHCKFSYSDAALTEEEMKKVYSKVLDDFQV